MVLNRKNMSKFNEIAFKKTFTKNYDKNIGIGYILEIDVEYPKRLHNLLDDLPFLPDITKIKKCHKLVCNLYDINNYLTHKITLKHALNHGLILKEAH